MEIGKFFYGELSPETKSIPLMLNETSELFGEASKLLSAEKSIFDDVSNYRFRLNPHHIC